MPNKLPPEWAPQDAIMLTWPHAETDWKSILNEVEAVFISICRAVSSSQKLIIICHNDVLKNHVCQLLAQSKLTTQNVLFVVTATNDSWARDHGPISIVNNQGQVVALDFRFNGWGNKYPANFDNQINQALFKQLGINHSEKLDIILEGGAIDIDEQGHLLTTKHCLLNINRNDQMSQTDIEGVLRSKLGAKKVLWLEHGALEGDDTDCHIDTLARFAPNQTIVYQGCDENNYTFFNELALMKRELMQLRSLSGDPFNLLELPWPSEQVNGDGERLPATYTNFLIINHAVLVPTYGVEQDLKALKIIQLAFPDYQIIAIYCRPIIEQYGSLHCLTMQLPYGFLSN